MTITQRYKDFIDIFPVFVEKRKKNGRQVFPKQGIMLIFAHGNLTLMKQKKIFIAAVALLAPLGGQAQKAADWTLQDCIEYALEHNIQLGKSRIAEEESEIDRKQSRAALFPSLSFSMTQSLQYRPLQQEPSNIVTNGMATSSSHKLTENGSYGLNASWTVWNGGANRKTVRAQELAGRIATLQTRETANSIQEQIARLYVQALYSQEAEKVNEKLCETAERQYQRGVEMKNEGLLALADLAQLEAQLSSSRYDVVNARTRTADYKLQLKKLLEIDAGQRFNIASSLPADEAALSPLPAQAEVREQALKTRPEIQSGELGLQAADMNVAIAKAGFYPTLSLNAGLGDSHYSGSRSNAGEQMKQNLSASVGVTVSVPIFDNRRNRSTLEKARLAQASERLDLQERRNTLSATIEEYWLNAYNSQQQFMAARSKVQSMQTSYQLLDERFKNGLTNIVELMTGRDNLLAALQEQLQSKYTAILNLQLLGFYQGDPIRL